MHLEICGREFKHKYKCHTLHTILENITRTQERPHYGTNKQDMHQYIQGTKVQYSAHWDKKHTEFTFRRQ